MEIEELADEMVKKGKVVVLTGAGISSNAGLPTFRGKGGLWTFLDPEKFTIEYFMEKPEEWWSFSIEFFKPFLNASPTVSHYAIAELERMGIVDAVITQNIDGLHQKAGSKNVIELHGNASRLKCIFCGEEYSIDNFMDDLENGNAPRCKKCGRILKSAAVLFGEEIPRKELMLSIYYASTCRIFLVVGTSLSVYPAAELPEYARKNGARVIYINREVDFDWRDYEIINADSDSVFPEVLNYIKKLVNEYGNTA